MYLLFYIYVQDERAKVDKKWNRLQAGMVYSHNLNDLNMEETTTTSPTTSTSSTTTTATSS